MKKLFPLILILTLMVFSVSCGFMDLGPDYDHDDDDYYDDDDDDDDDYNDTILYFKIDGFGIEGEPTLELATVTDEVITKIKLSGIERGNKIKATVLDGSKISTATVGVLREAVLKSFQTAYPISSARAVLDTDRYISRGILSRDIVIKNSVGSTLSNNYTIKNDDELTIIVSVPLKNGIRVEGNDYLIIAIIVNV